MGPLGSESCSEANRQEREERLEQASSQLENDSYAWHLLCCRMGKVAMRRFAFANPTVVVQSMSVTMPAKASPRCRYEFSHASTTPRLSLIEMMIATALLAASALLIQSLIGAGARFGVKAEQRTMAVGLAELALQEAMLDDESNDRESTEAFAHNPSWSYRIRQTPLETENLVEWKVDIFLTKMSTSVEPPPSRNRSSRCGGGKGDL